jgi:hypothetical protein
MRADQDLSGLTDEDRDFYRWYGAWDPLTPVQVAERFSGMPARWWIVGGWAVDAFTGVPREHEDIDVAFFRADLPIVLERLSPELCVWSNLSGTLRPLRKAEDLLEGARQLWVRRDGDSPWLMDLAMTPHDGDTWISPRDDRIRRPFDEATFAAADGIRYLRPELVLFMKARAPGVRSNDRDLATILPALEPERMAWLREAISLLYPGHRWLDQIQGDGASGDVRGDGASARSTLPSRKSRISSR